MGAITFFRTAYGKTPAEAFSDAYDAAQYECGHQGGYSGDLNSKYDFVLAQKPDDVELSVWIKALSEDNLSPALQIHSSEFARQQEIYNATSGPALCFEVSDEAQMDDSKEYIFVGWAPW
jgi:hypothetical protein